jgi:hypothetical protein
VHLGFSPREESPWWDVRSARGWAVAVSARNLPAAERPALEFGSGSASPAGRVVVATPRSPSMAIAVTARLAQVVSLVAQEAGAAIKFLSARHPQF